MVARAKLGNLLMANEYGKTLNNNINMLGVI
jgi:hypothetical protein